MASSAALGGFLFGYDSAVINGAVIGIQHHFGVSSSRTGTVVAVALLGSAFAGRLAERFGRLRVMHLRRVLGRDLVGDGRGAVSDAHPGRRDSVATMFNRVANWASPRPSRG